MWDDFIKATESHFGFLETEFGFTRVSSTSPIICYETSKLRVSLFFDQLHGYELDLVIRRAIDSPTDRKSINLGFLMLLKEGPDSKNYQSYRVSYPSTKDALETEVKRLADLLRVYGSHILRGDLSSFDKIEQIEKQELARAYARFRPKQ